MENLHLSRDNLAIICRLCLKFSRISISIFDRVDPNPNKKPLKDRIFDMYSIRISANDGLPTNICFKCLYNTEKFTDFCEKVRQCETKLQKFFVSMSLDYSTKPPLTENTFNGRLQLNADDNIVTIVDPSKEYQTSDDESSTSDIENLSIIAPPKQPPRKITKPKATEQIKNVFFCDYCDKAFVNQMECFRHESTHHGMHTCTFCTFQCSSRNTIIAHIKECHDPKPFLCTQCSKKFGRRSDLRKHSVVHTGIRPFRCKICFKNFSRNTNLTKHLRIHDKKEPRRDQESNATNVTRSRNDTENMVISLDPFNDHDSNVDDETQIRTLPQHTFAPFVSIESKSKQPSLIPPSLPTTSQCLPPIHMPLPNPINIPAQKPSIPVPVQLIEPIEIEPEPDTNIPALFRGSLPTEIVTFPTHVTGDAVTFMPNKVNTQPPPVKPKNFMCDHCPKKFATQSSLLNHKNIHSLRSHICLVCNKSFVRKRELDRHSTIHDPMNKPFICSVCPKKFGRKDKLVRHERTHSEVKIFSCPICHLAFNRKDGMILHMKVHGEVHMKPQLEMFNSAMLPLQQLNTEYNNPTNANATEPSISSISAWQNVSHPSFQ